MEEVVVVNDVIDLQGAPHTVCEISRESLSTMPEKSEEELYAQPIVDEPVEGEKTPSDSGEPVKGE